MPERRAPAPSRTRLGLVLDRTLPVGLAVLCLAETWADAPAQGSAKFVQTVGALLVSLPLLWRRIVPVPVLAAVVVGFTVVWFTEHRTGEVSFGAVVAMLVALYSVGEQADRRDSRPAALAALAVLALLLGLDVAAGHLRASDGVAVFLFFPTAWLLGDALRARRLRVVTLEERTTTLERERDEHAAAAAAAERARIARDLHDVIAHTTSLIVLQSGAARQVLRSSPAAAEDLLLSIERIGRDALAELRRLLGLLEAEGERAALTPQPGLGRLGLLVEEVTAAGVRLEQRVEGTPVALPPGLDLAAYRIVQEALTNVVKHAGPAHAELLVRYGHRDLELVVSDDGPASTDTGHRHDGRGIVGMCQRAALYGGHLDVGPGPDHGFVVRARLPLVGSET